MVAINFRLKRIFIRLPFGQRIWQIFKAIMLLRDPSFRELFLNVNRQDVCIDIGANIGYASLVMWLKGSKSIYALEPNIEAFKVLKKNLSGIHNISLFNIAVSSETRREKLYLHKLIKDKSNKDKIIELSQASSLLADKTNIGNIFYEIESKSLIDFFDETNQKPTIIKCDIEGGEYLIYEQLIQCAKLFKIRKIFVECHAKKYPQYEKLHQNFINLIKQNNLEDIIDTSWH